MKKNGWFMPKTLRQKIKYPSTLNEFVYLENITFHYRNR